MICGECIRAQRKGLTKCRRHRGVDATRQKAHRARCKAQGRCACGNELPSDWVTPLGHPVLKECLECTFKRGPRAIEPLVLTTQLNQETGEFEIVVQKRGKPTSVDVFRAAKKWREELSLQNLQNWFQNCFE